MWRNHDGPGLPGRSSQSFRSLNPMYTAPKTSSPAFPIRAPSYRSGGPSRQARVEIPTRLDPSSAQDHTTTPPPPPFPAIIDPPVSISVLIPPPAPFHKLTPIEPQPNVLVGFETYPSPPSSHVTRSGPPSPTNLPPVYSDTSPIIPLFSGAQSASSTLMRLTPETFENMVETMTGRVSFPGISGDMFSAWRSLYPVDMESKSLNYEYNSCTSRFIIKCPSSPVHESVSIFFTNRVSSGLQARLGLDTYEETVQVSSGLTFTSFDSKAYSPDTQKVPDAYLRVIGEDFPAVVCETGWSETMEDLREDAKLWLLGSYGQTRGVVVVNFQESKSRGQADMATAISQPQQSINGVELIVPAATAPASEGSESDGSNSIDGPAAAVHSQSETPLPWISDSFVEEAELISTVNHSTKLRDLADALLDLHHLGRLSQPLLGDVNATLHIFRLNSAGDDILETFTATILPAAPAASPQTFALTLADLLGPAVTAEHRLNPDEEIVFPLDRLRKVISDQIPQQEKHRAQARGKAILKACEVWDEDLPTFAQSMRMKRKRE